MNNKPTVDLHNAEIVKRGNYGDVIKQIIADGGCPFCEGNLKKYHPKDILITGEHWLVTENAWPYKGVKSHFLFISRAHVEKIEDVNSDSWQEFHILWSRIIKKYKITGASLLMRSGNTDQTGASVNHLHAQVVVGEERKKDSETITAIVGFKK